MSLLAIAETVMAVTILVTLSIWLDTVKWLALAGCLTPLLLLRTDYSVQKGLRWLDWVSDERRGKTWIPLARTAGVLVTFGICIWTAGWWSVLILLFLISPVFLAPLALAYLPVLCFGIRVGATIASVLRHPLLSLQAIPQNWRRIILATDTATDPEFLPGDEFGPLTFIRRGSPREPWTYGNLYIVALFLYIPAVVYRWSLKATCVIYLPLIWLIEAGRFSRLSIRETLDAYQASDLRRFRMVVSLVFLGALLLKVILLMTVTEFTEWWDTNGALQFLKLYIVPHQVPLWQIASALNAMLSIILWVYARRVLRLTEKNRPPPTAHVRVIWRIASVVSVGLSLYAIACASIITWKEGHLVASMRRLWSLIGKDWLP